MARACSRTSRKHLKGRLFFFFFLPLFCGGTQPLRLLLEPRALFPEGTEEGMSFEGSALPAGVSENIPKDAMYTVSEIYPEHLVLDGNHPLAGIAIRLDILVRSVREATEEEIGRGTAGTAFFKVQPLSPGNDTLH